MEKDEGVITTTDPEDQAGPAGDNNNADVPSPTSVVQEASEFIEVTASNTDDNNSKSVVVEPKEGAVVDKEKVAPTSLLEELNECMALSMLIYLLADLRLLSATGRIETRYEHLAADDDYILKNNANVLAGLAPSSAYDRLGENTNNSQGLSPAHLMAICMIELQSAAEERRKHNNNSSAAASTTQQQEQKVDEFTPLVNQKDQDPEGNIHSLLFEYAAQIGGDLQKKIDFIHTRRSNYNLSVDYDDSEEVAPTTTKPVRGLSKEEQMDSIAFNIFERCAPPPTGRGKGDLLETLHKAVESGNSQQLEFLSDFFRKDSISQRTISSHQRIVFMNDWFVTKEPTYAIAIDAQKRRVTVVFRGAKTNQDWSKALDFNLIQVPNPIADDFPDKPSKIAIHHGFYQYLFRKRKDTGTNKFEEICNIAHMYGLSRIGDDYHLFVHGHSLGAALTTVFTFYASLDERFTRNGYCVQALGSGSPYVGGYTFADCFRHQEETGKLLFTRFYNHNDIIARIPANLAMTDRGARYRHVGIAVKISPVSKNAKQPWVPRMKYVGNETKWNAYKRALGGSAFMNAPLLWRAGNMHTRGELQRRILEGRLRSPDTNTLLDKPMEEVYKELVEQWNKEHATTET